MTLDSMVGSTTANDMSLARDTAMDVLSHGVLPAPQWVTHILDQPAEKVAIVETVKLNEQRYNIILEFLAHRAVNIDEVNIPIAPVPSNGPKSSRLYDQVRREYPGLLSALSIPKGNSACSYSRMKMRPRSPFPLDDNDSDNEAEPDYPPLHFGLGRARLKHNGADICALHSITGRPGADARGMCAQYKAVYLYATSPDILRSLIKFIAEWAFERSKPDRTPRPGKYELYTLSIQLSTAKWKRQGWKKSRSLDTIFLKDNMLEAITEDFRKFTSKGTKDFYTRHGVPHRRSYMFYGPPGTGKTSCIRALAGNLNLCACFLELGDDNMSNSHLQQALRTLPVPAMLVIEDIDAVFKPTREAKNPRSALTFSGLLNALDGLVSTDGVLTVLTTNHVDRLDPALIRPGRIDRRFEFSKPGNKQFFEMFRSFYSDIEDKEHAQEFADVISRRPEKEAKSLATLMELFIHTREKSAKETLDSVDSFFKEFYPGSGHPDSCAWIYS